MTHAPHKLIPDSFTAVPSRRRPQPGVEVVATPAGDTDVVGYPVGPDDDVPAELGVSRVMLGRLGFTGAVGEALLLPGPGQTLPAAVGIGPVAQRTPAVLRDAAAAFSRAASRFQRLALAIGAGFDLPGEVIGRVITEGVLLARYRYLILKSAPADVPLDSLLIIETRVGRDEQTRRGAKTGLVLAAAENIARDLANTPPGHLTATEFGEVTVELAAGHGLTAEVVDKAGLIELGIGGLLGVNAGSAEEPRMIILRYQPEHPTGQLALVGKGIMYDSGGISLKPSDPMHFSMKMDMAGAAAIVGTMTALRDLDCRSAVTAWLMCTDNMPSGSATKLGDVLLARNGMTVEVKNTDAEGRLVMMDALVLATEERPDAIIDIATLTGAALRALGPACAVVLGNEQSLVDRVLAASRVTDEQAWQFPLEHKYRSWLDSDIADIANLGGADAGATTAALFLEEFVGGLPWAHIDIAGTMQTDKDDAWRSKGATGYGTRLLAELAVNFQH